MPKSHPKMIIFSLKLLIEVHRGDLFFFVGGPLIRSSGLLVAVLIGVPLQLYLWYRSRIDRTSCVTQKPIFTDCFYSSIITKS